MDWNQVVPNCTLGVTGQPDPNGAPTLSCITAVFINVVSAAFLFVGLIAVLMIIFAGYQFITSAGDPKQIQGAKSTITYAILGLVIVLMSFFIVNIIAYVTGVSCIEVFGLASCR